MKRFAMLVCCLMVAPLFAAWDINFENVSNPVSLEQLLRDRIGTLDDQILELQSSTEGKGTGNYYYVDSGAGSDSYTGFSWTAAKATIDAAINLCTASNGDVIFVAQGHAESGSAADLFDADVAGITIIGLGNGNNRPTITFADTDTTVAIGAANVTIFGLRFAAGISEVVTGISVEAGGDYFTLIDCEFPEPSTSTFEFDTAIQLTTGSDNVAILGCKAFSMDAAGATEWLDGGAGVVNGLMVVGNFVMGDYSGACIFSDQVDLECFIVGNYFQNTNAGNFAIEYSASATGFLANNYCYTNDKSTCIDPGAFKCFENYGTSSAGANACLLPEAAEPLDGTYDYIGFNDNDNACSTGSVASNRDGSILERLEFICKYFETGTPGALVAPASTYSLLDILGSDGSTTTGALAGSILGAIGTNEAASATPFTSATVESDRDGAVLERLEFLCKYFETGTPGALVAPANTFSLLDILGSDGSTTTGAVAGSILGAIGTNEAASATPFTSATVESDADGSVLERLEYLQAFPGTDSSTNYIGIDDASNLGTTTSVTADADGSVLERLEFIQQQYSATKVLTTIVNGNNNLFTVAGGPIKIIEIVGYVTTEIEGKSCLINYNIDPTTPATDTAFATDGTALEINGDTIGTLYTWDGVVATDLTATTNGAALGMAAGVTSGLICPAGSIELAAVVATSATGEITFYMSYIPLAPGVTVVAQ